MKSKIALLALLGAAAADDEAAADHPPKEVSHYTQEMVR